MIFSLLHFVRPFASLAAGGAGKGRFGRGNFGGAFPSLSNLRSQKNSADPLIVAVAICCCFRYCLSPGGWVGWSPRTFQALAAGCVPVLFKEDGERLPFDRLLNWTDISIDIDVSGGTEGIMSQLLAIQETEEEIASRREKMANAWRSFTYSRDPRVHGGGVEEGAKVVARVVGGGVESGTGVVIVESARGGAFDLILAELGERRRKR